MIRSPLGGNGFTCVHSTELTEGPFYYDSSLERRAIAEKVPGARLRLGITLGGLASVDRCLEYLMGRYGPTPLQLTPPRSSLPAYQQFLHMGEAGLATMMMAPLVSGFLAPKAERDNWGARWAWGASSGGCCW